MCDLTEVIYSPNDVVWVKLGPVWWPGRVCGEDEIPPEIMKDLRKTPIAIVKFFQEDSFEYVKSLSNIYHYHCSRKNEFIKKGLDMLRSKNRGAPSNMKLFPEDIVRAECLTNGNPAILQSDIFLPEEKPAYTDLFASAKKPPKKVKADMKKKQSPAKPNSPRLITHPRFLQLSSGQGTDYEVRERKQMPVRAECDVEDTSPPTLYTCTECDYTTTRLNVMVWHNKSHTRNYASPQMSGKATKRKSTASVKLKERSSSGSPSVESKAADSEEVSAAKIPKTNGTMEASPLPRKRGRPKGSTAAKKMAQNPPHTKEINSASTLRTPPQTRRRSSAHKGDEIHKSLLEDWLEDDAELEEPATDESSVADFSRGENTDASAAVNDSNSKSCFDFDDTEDHLVIDKSKFKPGRKIPRLLNKSAPLTIAPDDVVAMKESTDAMEVDVTVDDSTPKYQSGVGDAMNGEFSPSSCQSNQLQETGVDNEIEIKTEEVPVNEVVIESLPPKKSRRNLKTEARDAAGLHDQVEKLLNEISEAPAKLPNIPRSHKKAQVKAYQQQAEAEKQAAQKAAADAEAARKASEAEAEGAEKATAKAEAAQKAAVIAEAAQKAAAKAEAAQKAAAKAEAAQKAAAKAEAAQKAAAEAEAAQKAAAEAEAAQKAAAEAEAEAAQKAAAEAEVAQKAAAEAEAAQKAAAEVEAAQKAAIEAEAAQKVTANVETTKKIEFEVSQTAQQGVTEAEAVHRKSVETDIFLKEQPKAEDAQTADSEIEAVPTVAAKAEALETAAKQNTSVEREGTSEVSVAQQKAIEPKNSDLHSEMMDIDVSNIPLPSPKKCPVTSEPVDSSISIGASVTVAEDGTLDAQSSIISPVKVGSEALVTENVISGATGAYNQGTAASFSHLSQIRASTAGVSEAGGGPPASDAKTPEKLATICKTTKPLNATPALRSSQTLKILSPSECKALMNKLNASAGHVSPAKTTSEPVKTVKTMIKIAGGKSFVCDLAPSKVLLANSSASGSPTKVLFVNNVKKVDATSTTTATAAAATTVSTPVARSISLANATTVRLTPNLLQKTAAAQKAAAALAKSTGQKIVLDASTFLSLCQAQPSQLCKVQAAANAKPQTPGSVRATVVAASSPSTVVYAAVGGAPATNSNVNCANAVSSSSNADQTVEYDYFVDSSGNLVPADEPLRVRTPTKDKDILAKALENTDGLQTEMALSEAATNSVLDACSVAQNTEMASKAEVMYENLTLSTAPIMSAYETPSRVTAAATVLAEAANEPVAQSDAEYST